MVDLLKAFGRGVIYVIAFPFFLVFLAIFAAVGFLAFIFQLIKSVIVFFTGSKFFPELPEDKELRLRREAEEARNNPTPVMDTPAPQVAPAMAYEQPAPQVNVQRNPIPTPAPAPAPQPAPQSVEEACFQETFKEEPVKQEVKVEPKEEEIPVGRPDPEPTIVLTRNDPDEDPLNDFLNTAEEEEAVEEEILETYKPEGSDDSFMDEDNEESPMGVNIKFDD